MLPFFCTFWKRAKQLFECNFTANFYTIQCNGFIVNLIDRQRYRVVLYNVFNANASTIPSVYEEMYVQCKPEVNPRYVQRFANYK